MTPRLSPAIVLAAGGVLCRSAPDGERILVVHRKRYGDWTLPKGKQNPGESLEQTALREVNEETGCAAALAGFLETISYTAGGRPKFVFFWRMTVEGEGPIGDRGEVAEIEWVTAAEAQRRLTYPAERSLVARCFHSAKTAHISHAELEIEWWKRLWSWWKGERAYRRLLREFDAFRVELSYREQRSGDVGGAWADNARDQLENVRRHIEARDVEGGWHCLNAARQLIPYGLTTSELEDQARILAAESVKLSSWRRDAVKDLVDARPVTPERVSAAMAIRDEYAANQYHKIWLMADQLRVLLFISAAALIGFVPVLRSIPPNHTPWDFRLLVTVMLAGVLGAAFSAAQSLISNSNPSRIPERVANHFVTVIRSLFGSTAGLVGYVFLESKILAVKVGDDSIGSALAIALLFGYTGERLIARVADTVATAGDRK